MKYRKHAGRGLFALLAALTLAPISAYARDPEPVARTKPVIDHAQPHKKVARAEHEQHTTRQREREHARRQTRQ
jgi:hypothetical protein